MSHGEGSLGCSNHRRRRRDHRSSVSLYESRGVVGRIRGRLKTALVAEVSSGESEAGKRVGEGERSGEVDGGVGKKENIK